MRGMRTFILAMTGALVLLSCTDDSYRGSADMAGVSDGPVPVMVVVGNPDNMFISKGSGAIDNETEVWKNAPVYVYSFRKDLNRFQPFGPGNVSPVFVTYSVSNHGDAKLVGVEHEHLRMDLIQRQKPNTRLQAIAFQQPTHFEWVRSGRPIDVCYQIVENHYRGTVTTQLRIKDIKPVVNR